MPKKINMLYKRIGKLTVIECLGKKTRKTNLNKTDIYWNCLCDCGKTKEVPTSHLTKGNTKSCGCLIIENALKTVKFAHKVNKLPDGEAAFNEIYSVYKRTAENRNLNFELTKDQCKQLFKANCNYCGIKPSNLNKYYKNEIFKYNGIDRLNNDIGYKIDNVVTCCHICNWMKKDLSKIHFLEHIDKIHYYGKGKDE